MTNVVNSLENGKCCYLIGASNMEQVVDSVSDVMNQLRHTTTDGR